MLSNPNFTITSTFANDNGNASGGCPPVGVQLEGVILPPVLVIDIVLGLLGNTVALWIFWFKLKMWKPNDMFLFNLVIADFLALVSLPLRVDALLRGYWVFGDIMCRINFFLMFSNRTASIALMTLVAVYRYFKVVHPHHHFNHMTMRLAALVLMFVWVLVIAPRVPLLAFNHLKGSGEQTQCFFFASYKEESEAIVILVGMHRILSVLEFIIPLGMLLFCSIRIGSSLRERQFGKSEKMRKAMRKAMRVCVTIVVVFVVCFLPTTVTTIGVWMVQLYRPWDCLAFYTFTQLTIVSFGLNFLNSALDPIIYVFSSSTFRKALLDVLPCGRLCGHEADEITPSSSTAVATGTQHLELSQRL